MRSTIILATLVVTVSVFAAPLPHAYSTAVGGWGAREEPRQVPGGWGPEVDTHAQTTAIGGWGPRADAAGTTAIGGWGPRANTVIGGWGARNEPHHTEGRETLKDAQIHATTAIGGWGP